ncbi:SEL1-like repeat protein [Pelagibius sp.]|uniref:SEL1-like repeat protein n=1 Tax=Pelagibius sp. TaxID=1931238 RepID=UPI00263908B6|nr:SEL1-like repeat protein [Pelagibius sp.]
MSQSARGLLPVLTVLMLLVLACGSAGPHAAEPSGTPERPASESAPEASAPAQAGADAEAGPDAGSPWEHDLWNGATTMMRIYVCSHARRTPTWCGEERTLPSKAPLPDEQGPPLTDEDAAWLAFLEQADPAALSADEVAVIRRRAVQRRDPQAMEILGFLYAQGASVRRDYAEAYRWYGRAYLAGERRVRANMDVVWALLQKHDLPAALALTREFNALADGAQLPMAEVPADAMDGAGPASPEKDPTGL